MHSGCSGLALSPDSRWLHCPVTWRDHAHRSSSSCKGPAALNKCVSGQPPHLESEMIRIKDVPSSRCPWKSEEKHVGRTHTGMGRWDCLRKNHCMLSRKEDRPWSVQLAQHPSLAGSRWGPRASSLLPICSGDAISQSTCPRKAVGLPPSDTVLCTSRCGRPQTALSLLCLAVAPVLVREIREAWPLL